MSEKNVLEEKELEEVSGGDRTILWPKGGNKGGLGGLINNDPNSIVKPDDILQ